MSRNVNRGVLTIIAVGLVATWLTGCSMGGGEDSGSAVSVPAVTTTTTTTTTTTPTTTPTTTTFAAADASSALASGAQFPGESVKNSLTSSDYASAAKSIENVHGKTTTSGILWSVKESGLEAAIRAAASDLDYSNPNCLACHSKPSDISDADYKKINAYYTSDILSETSKDGTVAMAHVKMLPFITGGVANSVFPLKANSAQCRVCHQAVDTTQNETSGNLRRNVNVDVCATPACHGAGSTGSVFYENQ